MRFLILRDPAEPLAYEFLFDHLATYSDIDLVWRSLLDPVPHDLKTFDLCIPWLQDPCDDRPATYGRALGWQDLCDLVGVPVINRPESLPNARKSKTSKLLTDAALGLRVPRIERITDIERFREDFLGLPFPLFVREDAQHAATLFRADSPEEARAPEFLEHIHKMKEPAAVEYIETALEDGLYHKYRYAVAGDKGVPLHLQITPNWITRGEDRSFTDDALIAEKVFVNSATVNFGRYGPGFEMLNAAAKALGFDFCAFDYAYDQDNRLVVWEANPLPFLHQVKRFSNDSPGVDLEYRNVATRRALDAVVEMYRRRSLHTAS